MSRFRSFGKPSSNISSANQYGLTWHGAVSVKQVSVPRRADGWWMHAVERDRKRQLRPQTLTGRAHECFIEVIMLQKYANKGKRKVDGVGL